LVGIGYHLEGPEEKQDAGGGDEGHPRDEGPKH